METQALLVFLLIGLVAGFLASLVVGGGGLIRCLLSGFHVQLAGGRLGYFVTGFLGACLLIFLARLVRR
ncbi:GlsB/YeaQ/YmgE family stress response membrane protein [Rhizobium lentis]|nr:GlsB/YeaQ/YmgE family stress response membrane protein [Rhizobium lentis]